MNSNATDRLVIFALALSTSGYLGAAGFQSTTHSAVGVGRANSGEAAIGDNASILGRNPAGMMLFDKPELTVGVQLVVPKTHVTDATSESVLGQSTSMNDETLTSIQPAPHIYYIHPINERIAVGAALYSNFATGTEFTDEWNVAGELFTPLGNTAMGGVVGGKTSVTTVNMNFSVAGKIVDGLSIGVGLDVLYGSGLFERPLYLNGSDSGLGLDFEGDGYSTGWDAGLLWELNERNRFGLSYHSDMSFTADGDGTYQGNDFDETKLNLPARAEFSGFHQVTDRWAVHYDVQWIGWAVFDQIEFGDVLVKEYNWNDSMRYAIGGTYTIGRAWTWRLGVAYDESPVPADNRSVSIPDSNRNWYSTGATWKSASQRHAVDMAFAYIQGEKVDVTEEALPGFSFVNAETKTDAVIIGGSYSFQF